MYPKHVYNIILTSLIELLVSRMIFLFTRFNMYIMEKKLKAKNKSHCIPCPRTLRQRPMTMSFYPKCPSGFSYASLMYRCKEGSLAVKLKLNLDAIFDVIQLFFFLLTAVSVILCERNLCLLF